MVSAGLLTATLAIGGFQAAGYGSNHQDLSPKYSGILFGLSNASASSAGALAVFITGQSMRTEGLTMCCITTISFCTLTSDCAQEKNVSRHTSEEECNCHPYIHLSVTPATVLPHS